MTDPAVLHAANRFEAVAAAALDGVPHDADLRRLVAETRARGPAFTGQVAHALTMMIGWIAEDDAVRFAPKIAILNEAVVALVGKPDE
ncbi:hypothetical protein [Azospirillum sp. ST 5-10]|uniref:hypothetical protein n=1 Tax=unclassified Azospirillum TaxID=2630922 RepID=UPI003F49C993